MTALHMWAMTAEMKCFKFVCFLIVRKKYKYVKRDRVFPAKTSTLSPTSSLQSESSQPGTSGGSKPLNGMKFVVSKTNKSRADITKQIQSLGGSATTKVDKKTAAVISTKGSVIKVCSI